MHITFDSNAWQRVVRPNKFGKDIRQAAFVSIHNALKTGLINGYICETVGTLEAIRKIARTKYLEGRQSPVSIVDEQVSQNGFRATIQIAGRTDDHPGLPPILVDMLNEAFSLGLKIIPSSRLGMPRPTELDREDIRIPLTSEQRSDIWPLLERINQVTCEIESRNCGRAILEKIASRIRTRHGLVPDPWTAWFDGLSQPGDVSEEREIEAAFAEWADADSIALHIGYGLDIFCTEDFGKSSKLSVFSSENRQWLREAYGVKFMTLSELAKYVE